MDYNSIRFISVFIVLCFFVFIFLRVRNSIRRHRVEKNLDKYLRDKDKSSDVR